MIDPVLRPVWSFTKHTIIMHNQHLNFVLEFQYNLVPSPTISMITKSVIYTFSFFLFWCICSIFNWILNFKKILWTKFKVVVIWHNFCSVSSRCSISATVQRIFSARDGRGRSVTASYRIASGVYLFLFSRGL